jgi:hypothetical protein
MLRGFFRLSNWKDPVELCKNLVEIFAILVGGYWTYNKFVKTERDAMSLRAESKIEVVSKRVGRLCRAEAILSIKNIGSRDFPETTVNVDVFEMSVDDSIAPLRIEPSLFTKYGKRITGGQAAMASIPVGMHSRNDLTWLLRPTDATYYFFLATFSKPLSRENGYWGRVCE